MKKLLFVLCLLVCTIVFNSCSKDDAGEVLPPENTDEKPKFNPINPRTFEINTFRMSDGTFVKVKVADLIKYIDSGERILEIKTEDNKILLKLYFLNFYDFNSVKNMDTAPNILNKIGEHCRVNYIEGVGFNYSQVNSDNTRIKLYKINKDEKTALFMVEIIGEQVPSSLGGNYYLMKDCLLSGLFELKFKP